MSEDVLDINLPASTIEALELLRMRAPGGLLMPCSRDPIYKGLLDLVDAYAEEVKRADSERHRADVAESVVLNVYEDLLEHHENLYSLVRAVGDSVNFWKDVDLT